MNKFYSLLQTGVSAIALSCLAGTVFAADVASEGELKSALQTGSDATLTGDILLTGNLPEAAILRSTAILIRCRENWSRWLTVKAEFPASAVLLSVPEPMLILPI